MTFWIRRLKSGQIIDFLKKNEEILFLTFFYGVWIYKSKETCYHNNTMFKDRFTSFVLFSRGQSKYTLTFERGVVDWYCFKSNVPDFETRVNDKIIWELHFDPDIAKWDSERQCLQFECFWSMLYQMEQYILGLKHIGHFTVLEEIIYYIEACMDRYYDSDEETEEEDVDIRSQKYLDDEIVLEIFDLTRNYTNKIVVENRYEILLCLLGFFKENESEIENPYSLRKKCYGDVCESLSHDIDAMDENQYYLNLRYQQWLDYGLEPWQWKFVKKWMTRTLTMDSVQHIKMWLIKFVILDSKSA